MRKYFTAPSVEAHITADEANQDIRRERHQLQAQVDGNQVATASHEHHANRGKQQQGIVFTVVAAFVVQIAQGDEHG